MEAPFIYRRTCGNGSSTPTPARPSSTALRPLFAFLMGISLPVCACVQLRTRPSWLPWKATSAGSKVLHLPFSAPRIHRSPPPSDV